jgi:5'-nucleotidase
VTSADKYGTVVSEIDITLDPKSGDVMQARADNLIVRTDRYAKDPAQSKLIATYEQLAAPLAKRVVGRVGAPLTRDESPAGESPIGGVVADAQLAATADAGAQLALMNPGGLRANLSGDASGQVRYEDLFSVQPFYNNLVTLTLSGAQLQRALEQQWLNQPRARVLQVSRGFTYTWDNSKPPGQRIVPGSLQLNGAPIEPQQRLRVTVNSFLAGGGDNFSVFKQDGQDARTGMMDIDAFERYVAAQGSVAPVAAPRIQRVN